MSDVNWLSIAIMLNTAAILVLWWTIQKEIERNR